METKEIEKIKNKHYCANNKTVGEQFNDAISEAYSLGLSQRDKDIKEKLSNEKIETFSKEAVTGNGRIEFDENEKLKAKLVELGAKWARDTITLIYNP